MIRYANIRRLGSIAALLPLLLLSACAMAPQQHADYSPVLPPPPKPAAQNDGAIYQAGYGMSLFDDVKAHQVGDIITIVLNESTQASKQASTNTKKKDSIDIANPTILGSTPQFGAPGILPLASNRNNTLANSLSSDQAFGGSGDSSQSNSLTGNITVTVARVLSNGNLMVRGQKHLTLNQGDEVIQISGMVRPVDISSDNTVPSYKVADARITYSGNGAVADANRMGWLSRFFLSPYWPF
ncbi:MAG: flagellar basal body L-ring protein FlgH [Gammaproteobacteria bacterium]